MSNLSAMATRSIGHGNKIGQPSPSYLTPSPPAQKKNPARPDPSPGSADSNGLRPLPPTPKEEPWHTTLINSAGSEACRALRRSKVDRKQCFEGRKWHPESLPGIPKTLLAALRRTLVEPWPSQPLGKRRGVCGLQRIAHPPAGTPVTGNHAEPRGGRVEGGAPWWLPDELLLGG